MTARACDWPCSFLQQTGMATANGGAEQVDDCVGLWWLDAECAMQKNHGVGEREKP